MILSKTSVRILVTDLNQTTQLGPTKLSELLRPRCVTPRLDSLVWMSQADARSVLMLTENREPLPRKGPNERSISRQTLGKLTSPRSGLLGRIKVLASF